MKRTFAPNEFSFSNKDLETPNSLMECLKRMEPSQINVHGYATKLYQAVTNQNSFDSDAWFDVGFEVFARLKLQTFIAALAEWHQTHGVEKQFLPDILADSFLNTTWVKDDLTAVGMVPGKLAVKPLDTPSPIDVSNSSLSM